MKLITVRIPILALALCTLLSACSSGAYDDEREWRLSQCENILDDDDRAKCIRDTPYYTQ